MYCLKTHEFNNSKKKKHSIKNIRQKNFQAKISGKKIFEEKSIQMTCKAQLFRVLEHERVVKKPIKKLRFLSNMIATQHTFDFEGS